MVDGYISSSPANTHGIRKGSLTYSTSGTIVPPSLILVALRGGVEHGESFGRGNN